MIDDHIFLTINVFAVPNLNHQDYELLVLNFAYNTEVTYSISPQFSERGALKRFSQPARIFANRQSLSEKIKYAL